MRKKKLSFEKKLSLNKETIASLNTAQLAVIAGGAAPVTQDVRCSYTYYETCMTIPVGEKLCVNCNG